MQLHNILSGASFTTGFIGLSGIGGAIEYGTGIGTIAVLLLISLLCGLWASYENGTLRRKR